VPSADKQQDTGTRVLVIGGDGMFGHKAVHVLNHQYAVWATTRQDAAAVRGYPGFETLPAERLFGNVDARDIDAVTGVIERASPDVVVNAVGIVKQVPQAHDAIPSIEVNALFPHRLAHLCNVAGARLIHLSTDCVFSGATGMYTERDAPAGDDLYARSKLLGEVVGPGCLTLRTSMIGRQVRRQTGLLEWFLAQRGKTVQGYTNAIFSGLTTESLARMIGAIIARHPDLTGLYHLSTTAISKCDLLGRLRTALDVDVEIVPVAGPHCDRSLDGTRFVAATDERVPGWDEMIAELAADATPYDTWWRDQRSRA
jgi:dTDP-4-dehydrorhamnose reductase